MKELTKMGALLAAVLAPSVALAQPFSWELGGSYQTADTDLDEIEVNEDNFSLYATYFFDRVDPGARALREAPFLDRASYVGIGADVRDLDDELGNVVETDAYRINGRLVGVDSGWFADLGYVDADASFDAGSAQTAVVGYRPAYDGYAVTIGRYLARFTTIGVSYSAFDYEGDFFIQSTGRRDNDMIGVAFKHYGPITGFVDFSVEANYRFIDLETRPLADEAFENSGEIYDVAFTLYPNPNIGVGVQYADADDARGMPFLTTSAANEDGLGVFVDWFVTDRLSLRASYNNRDYDLSSGLPDSPGEVESDTLLVGVAFRL